MIKVSVANSREYNKGKLVAEWLELPTTTNKIEKCLDAIKVNKEYETYFIVNYETDIDGLVIGECDELEELNELSERYEALQESDKNAVKAIIEVGYNLVEALNIVEEGRYRLYEDCYNFTGLAHHMVNDGAFGDVDAMGILTGHINYEGLGNSLSTDGYKETSFGIVQIY